MDGKAATRSERKQPNQAAYLFKRAHATQPFVKHAKLSPAVDFLYRDGHFGTYERYGRERPRAPHHARATAARDVCKMSLDQSQAATHAPRSWPCAGMATAVKGNRVVVGGSRGWHLADGFPVPVPPTYGYAFLFDTEGVVIEQLVPTNVDHYEDSFGQAVTITSDGTCVVSAKTAETGLTTGVAYVFDED